MFLQVRRIEVHYWKTPREELYSYKNFPVFIAYDVHRNDGWFHMFGLPIFEYPGMVKVQHVLYLAVISIHGRVKLS